MRLRNIYAQARSVRTKLVYFLLAHKLEEQTPAPFVGLSNFLCEKKIGGMSKEYRCRFYHTSHIARSTMALWLRNHNPQHQSYADDDDGGDGGAAGVCMQICIFASATGAWWTLLMLFICPTHGWCNAVRNMQKKTNGVGCCIVKR